MGAIPTIINMLSLTLITILTIISSILLIVTSPIIIGLIILSTAIIVTIIFTIYISSLIAILIFLIYIRGILVLFSYFVAITPNQNKSINLTILISTTILIPALLYTWTLSTPHTINTTNIISAYLYYKHSTFILIRLATILLLTIVLVVKLASKFKGPLRPFI